MANVAVPSAKAAIAPEVVSALEKHGELAPFVQADLLRVRDAYAGVRVELRDFVTDDGVTRRWVALCGSLPTNFNGNVYHLPFALYLVDTFPTSPPLAYVEPTADMAIAEKHPHVDYSGRVYLPYLHGWDPRKGSSLLGVAQAMIGVFEKQPPLYARPNTGLAQPPVLGAVHPDTEPPQRPASVNSMLTADPALVASPPSATPEEQRLREQLAQLIQSNLQLFTHEVGPQSDQGATYGHLQANNAILEQERERLSKVHEQLEGFSRELESSRAELAAWLDAESQERGSEESAQVVDIVAGDDNNNNNIDDNNDSGKDDADKDDDEDDAPSPAEASGAPDRPPASVDTLVVGVDETAETRLQLVALDVALDDTLYQLNQALYRGVLEQEQWQSEYRRLCQEQFMTRARIARIVSR
jgi:ESCRT-I complex subunit TSG101